MIFRLAEINDIANLVKIRLDFCRQVIVASSHDQNHDLAPQLQSYYRQHLGLDFIAALAEDGPELAAVAFLNLIERPASHALPKGRSGEIGNVYSYQQYRRRGLASQLIKMLINEANERQLDRLDVSANEEGLKIYKELGFRAHAGYTRLILPLA